MSDRLAPSAAPPSSTAPPAPRWRRSSHSTGMNNCVETALLSGGALLGVRDSKDVRRAPLCFSAAAWSTFVDGLGPHGANTRRFN
ncbi:DUF397 domain-containing protein [Streptomyces sp. NPDC017520]|uniref:DUF397 domain-containing protein n=1 Tax=Streptomyces sp. NPDC017520 TaxID=3364998 RepID=UPI0037AA2A6D